MAATRKIRRKPVPETTRCQAGAATHYVEIGSGNLVMQSFARNDRVGRALRFSAPVFSGWRSPPRRCSSRRTLVWHFRGSCQRAEAPTNSAPATASAPPEATTRELEASGGTVLVYQVETQAVRRLMTCDGPDGAGLTRRLHSLEPKDRPRVHSASSCPMTSRDGDSGEGAAGWQGPHRDPGAGAGLVSAGTDQPPRAAALGTLEFAILANRRDHQRLFDFDAAAKDPDKSVVVDKKLVAEWREVARRRT